MKIQEKELTHLSSPKAVITKIETMEDMLSKASNSSIRSNIKTRLSILYRIRHKQKNYTSPPKKKKDPNKGF